MIGDFMMDHMGWVFGAFCALIVGLLIVGAVNSVNEKAAFMAECVQDHKQYECDAIWRSGEPDYIPVPIFIPSR